MTFIIDFLGCKVNSYEAECIGDLLIKEGYVLYDEKKHKNKVDVVIINTCAVTETSVSKDRKMIRQYRRKYKHAIIVVMGCYAQYESEYISTELKADIVLGTSERTSIPELIKRFKEEKMPIVINENNNSIKKYEKLDLYNSLLTTRAYLKIQDGCDNYCTYCLIPYIRGRSRSRKKEDILAEVRRLIDAGYKEIVITGIDLGSYGSDLYKTYNISSLLKDILEKNKDLYRLRLSSIEESQIDDKFISLLKDYPNFANHLHIPLQSGSVSVLKKMNRKYDLESFKRTIAKIRSVRKDIAISTDVIVGFPGEMDEDYDDTRKFCKEIKFSKIHVFPFSPRRGTIAAKLSGQVENSTKKLRVLDLIALSDEMAYKYNKQFNNKDIEFLFENYDAKKKEYRGHSSNYLEVYVNSDKDLQGQIETIKYKVKQEEVKHAIRKIFRKK